MPASLPLFPEHIKPFYTLLTLGGLVAAPAAFAQTPDAILDARNASETTRLRVNVDGGLLVGGEYDGDGSGIGVPIEGEGTRLMWYPRKAAFRAGYVQGGQFGFTDSGGSSYSTSGTVWDAANIGDASAAFGMSSRASASYAFAAGLASTAAQQSSVAMGEFNVASGAASVALGYHAHTNARQGSFVFGDRSSVDYIRAGVNHSANWRVSGGFRIFTSSNLSTGVTVQSGASVSNWGQSNAVISTSTGAYLSTSGVWTNASDVNRKRDFVPVAGEDVLARLRRLPISTWTYKTEPSGVRHMGPMAQDFKAAFGLGNDDKTIGTVDADGVALAAVQALEARTTRQQTEIDALKAQNEALRVRLEALESRTGTTPVQAMLPLIAGLVGLGGLAVGLGRRRARA